MKILDIVLIGIALSMDAVALTISNCSTYKDTLNKKKEWSMPIFFGLFQGVMPLIGYFLGTTFSDKVAPYAEYLSFAVFFLLALKILIDIIRERKGEENEKPIKKSKFSFTILTVQAVATSIDALIIGITLTSLSLSIYIAVSIIAIVTFILVSVALLFGKYLGKILGKYAELVGMIILFALSIKSLIQAII